MKKLFWISLGILLLSAFAVTGVFADASGEMYKLYEGGVIVNNTWEYVESEKTLYIRSKVNGIYNETGNTSYDSVNKAWEAYRTEIEHVVLEGTFNKCSGGAFKNHTSLKDIRITSDTTQFDGSCFEGCKSLESITVGDNEHIKGYADLSNATVLRGNRQFYGTAITEAYILNDIGITGKEQFNAGITIYAPKNTKAYEYFTEAGLYTVIDNSPVEISVNVGGEVFTELYPYGSSFVFPTFGGDCVALYYDEAFTKPYLKHTATESVTLYGKPLLEYVGAMVRSEGYHGLRMIYSVDENSLDVLHGYVVKEFGALAMKQAGIGKQLSVDLDNIHKTVVYSNGEYKGNLISVPSGGVTSFAYTAVGFEQDGGLNVKNAEQNLYFRGYIILVSPDSGEEVVCYTEQTLMNLADGCHKTLEANEANGGALLDESETAFITSPLKAGATINYVYTKEDLLNVIEDIYNDEEHYIPGQHLGSGANALSEFLDRSYETSGAYPALAAFDLMDFTVYNSRVKSIIDECKEYIRMGGIVSFSYHMENPTGNYTEQGLCRGELGGEDVWIDLMTDGTALNDRFNEILDYAGVILNEFDREGYPVIWRPLHENNGGWFWWCAVQTFEEEGKEVTRAIDRKIFIDLWEYVYHYYTDVWGLKNLVWAYSPNVSNSETSPVPVMYGYPGDEYCDIAGTDWYTSGSFEVNGKGRSYLNLMEQTGKPAALTEFGPSGSLRADASLGQTQADLFSCREQLDIIKRMMAEGMKITYVLNWSGSWSMLNLGNMEVLMQDETAHELSEVKEIFNRFFDIRNSKQ